MDSIWLRHGEASLHVGDFGGSGPTVLLVHGLGGSHANYAALGPLLAERARVLALDLPGFGLSPPGAGVDMPSFANAVDRVVDAIRAREIEGARLPLLLAGNSMGGAVAILAAGARPADVERLVLICPALPVSRIADLDPRFTLLLTSSMLPGYDAFLRRRLRETGPEAMVYEMLSLTCADKSRVPASAVTEMLGLARRRAKLSWMATSFSSAARSVAATLIRREAFRASMRAVKAPVLLVHGDRDRLVPVSSARAALDVCPHWTLEIYEGIGHVPQLEAADRLAGSMTRFFEPSIS